MNRQPAVLALLFVLVGAGCKSCSNPGGSCGNQGDCPTGQVRICQSKCVTPLPTGSLCNPLLDCNDPQTCAPYQDSCQRLQLVEGFACQPAITWGNACTPGIDDNHCGAGLFCMAREDYGPIDWPPGTPPGFCTVDRAMGASCVGRATHRQLACDSGLVCASDGICHTQCASDSDCPCNSGQSCINPGSVSPPSETPGNACYLCADRGLQTGLCDATHPCCTGLKCEYVYYNQAAACCEPRGAACDPTPKPPYCCVNDVCYADSGASPTCHACTETGAACTASVQCCGHGGAACCGSTCANVFTDVNNCGSCGHICPAYQNAQPPTCNQGTCTFLCRPNFGNCNSIITDGCETDLLDDPNNCGYCGHHCGSGNLCVNGKCESTGGGGGGGGGTNCLTEGQRMCVPGKYDGPHCCGTDSGNKPPLDQPDLECVYQTCRSCAQKLGQICDGQNGHPYLCCMVRNPGDPDIQCAWNQDADTDTCKTSISPPHNRPVGPGPAAATETGACAPPGASCRIKTENKSATIPCCEGACSPAGVCPRSKSTARTK